ncbi:MAG: tyrosine-type recombinase/integrase [Actinomycetota bacterium]|nr:tyrosine-type recombinase/integrase [Actinomycetota bacterium]MDA8359680.1 tyrosine-type recombinase/integrase [Actinomycetota bacterium]
MPKVEEGPTGLAEHVRGYHAHLLGLGYSRSAAKKHRQLVVHLSEWMERYDVAVQDLTAAATEGFFRARRAHGTPNLRTPRSLDPLLAYLRDRGIVASPVPAVPSDPVGWFLARYRRYLLEERGVVEGTAHFYVYIARLFAEGQRSDDGLDWSTLRAGEVTSFAARTCAGRSLSSARQVVSALRSVLRFLAMEGLCAVRLDQAVLSVAGSASSLPRGIGSADVEKLVAACAGRRAIELRDRAIVLLLCRLGLRGGEVVGLRLDDIDWRSGVLVVRGKGGRRDRLPVSEEVGGALADYLAVRPSVEDRAVFLRQSAPRRALAETGSLRAVMARACARAGIAYVNPHRLRHTVATSMLRQGVSLNDIGQVLGHQATAVTATYASVDLVTLRAIARPWPAVRP